MGTLARKNEHSLELEQRGAWLSQLLILKDALRAQAEGMIFLEFKIPRMGKRADAVLLFRNVVVVLEFKVGAQRYESSDFSQVEDYALDLKNFHEGSHHLPIVPLLIATDAPSRSFDGLLFADDLVARPVGTNKEDFAQFLDCILGKVDHEDLNWHLWIGSGYRPTPTIIEAAETLYRTHTVEAISRWDAGVKNLRETNASVSAAIEAARLEKHKAICFVTGVPGAGKTLAGMNIAMRRSEEQKDEHAVFLSGNGPLVEVLREALTRDQLKRERTSRSAAEQKVCSFIQNIHHFRDYYRNNAEEPIEKVVIFDEAQRAWNQQEASKFVRRKHGVMDFNMSEPEFLIQVMDRHTDWCVIVCLVGGGQEINTGEAGISEWMDVLERRFPDWRVYISPQINLPEYGLTSDVAGFLTASRVRSQEHLHLAVPMRSFRSEKVSQFIHHVVDNEPEKAKELCEGIGSNYPIFLTRELDEAREWLRKRARGTERFGLVASSGALRLRPEGIHIKAAINPSNWFLNSRDDVRSSFYLEEVATEFAVQGLELDWVGVCWDGDFRHYAGSWSYRAFRGTKWLEVNDSSRRRYLKNAYRVLLTRARQGMVLFVPKGDLNDHTRRPAFYDSTYNFLFSCGIPEIAQH